MSTRKFCGGSVGSLQDFYENTEQPDLRLNLGEMLENQAISKRDSKVFHYCVKTKAGDVPLKTVVGQLRSIAKFLEKQQLVSNVVFSLQVDEVVKK